MAKLNVKQIKCLMKSKRLLEELKASSSEDIVTERETKTFPGFDHT